MLCNEEFHAEWNSYFKVRANTFSLMILEIEESYGARIL